MAPGDKASITVELLCDGDPGKAQKSIEVWTNDPENGMISLILHGVITQ
ncbi:hypothetical protein HWQ67_01275 [Candidatus Magnetobacterium casensis]|uniref:Uncharacterized protein n=1 Tax=Candidatus Magnetobacterium casense TaxID=1455061 RepID=A0ABS6RU97_9BACT|nr:hypothetical protein [Candidatus Magnetobacterium casensis]